MRLSFISIIARKQSIIPFFISYFYVIFSIATNLVSEKSFQYKNELLLFGVFVIKLYTLLNEVKQN